MTPVFHPGSAAPDAPASSRRFGSEAVLRLQVLFEDSLHPMLMSDDERRWVNGNEAAAVLLGITRAEIPWHSMDDFTPPAQYQTLEERWNAFLNDHGEREGTERLYVPGRGLVPVEYSAIANVLPGRHLSVVIPLGGESTGEAQRALGQAAEPAAGLRAANGRLPLTEREREVITLVASGLQSGEIADRLCLSAETVKSHVNNAMGKLGVHTRAHAVAVALVTGQVVWDKSRPLRAVEASVAR